MVLTVEQDQPPSYHPGVEGVRPVGLLLVPVIRDRAHDRRRQPGRGRAEIGGLRLATARRYRVIRILFSLFLLRLCNRKKNSAPVRTVTCVRLVRFLADSAAESTRSLREKFDRVVRVNVRVSRDEPSCFSGD